MTKVFDPRGRHRTIIDYLKTLPGVLTGVAALIGATTGLVVALLR
ncbi:hypothetical protein [Micromonospora sp. LOL_015]